MNIFGVFNFVWSVNHFSPFFLQLRLFSPKNTGGNCWTWSSIWGGEVLKKKLLKVGYWWPSDDLFLFLIKGSIKSFGLMNGLFFPSIFFKLLYFSIVFWLHEGIPIFLGGRLFFPKWSHGTADGAFSCISTKECDVFFPHMYVTWYRFPAREG